MGNTPRGRVSAAPWVRRQGQRPAGARHRTIFALRPVGKHWHREREGLGVVFIGGDSPVIPLAQDGRSPARRVLVARDLTRGNLASLATRVELELRSVGTECVSER